MIPKYIQSFIKPLKSIAKAYRAKVYFGTAKGQYSFSYPCDDYIYVNVKNLDGSFCSKRRIFSYFFHELAHILIYRAGKFPIANQPLYYSELEKINYRKTVVKFEKYTDKIGRVLMKQWFSDMRYEKSYNTKVSIQNLLKQAKALEIETAS